MMVSQCVRPDYCDTNNYCSTPTVVSTVIPLLNALLEIIKQRIAVYESSILVVYRIFALTIAMRRSRVQVPVRLVIRNNILSITV